MPIYKVLKLLDGDLVLGEVEAVHTEHMTEILLKKPFTVTERGAMPYMYNILRKSPAAIQLNPGNIIWTAPLADFPDVEKVYLDATTKIVKPESKIITL